MRAWLLAGLLGLLPVHAVAGIREIVSYLYESGIPLSIDGERRPMDPGTKQRFERYFETYGVV